ncbi:MAG: cytochrome P450 [Actinomycetota bacterium]
MTDTTTARQEWLARTKRRNPEVEQVKFGADVPAASELTIDAINPFNAHLFREDRWQEHFARLRAESPVHLNELGSAGRYWSITTWEDIRAIEGNWQTFSSEQGITLDRPVGEPLPEGAVPFRAFITMDPPEQTEQRKTVRGISAPSNLRAMEQLIRDRTVTVLDSLPEGETFDWVDTVSIELTTLMLATLFDFPMEDRRKLTRWSDLVTTIPEPGTPQAELEGFRAEILEMLTYFQRLWEERIERPGHDLISMLAHGEPTKDMTIREHLGNLLLLIVGGNDTTRNSMSGSVYALDTWPEQFAKLQTNPELISNLVPEIIRWQTPLAYMRRTANEDHEYKGNKIKQGDQILLWYVSANRDESVFGETADVVDLDRPNADRHLAFGHGIHYCMGARIAELQLRILWEEILPRFERIEVMAEPDRTLSSFVKGYTRLPVQVHWK